MAQIRSKQIADFLASVNWTTVTANDIANASDISKAISAEVLALEGADDAISANLSTEIVDRTADVSNSVSTEAYNRSVADAAISANLSQELVDRSNAVSTEAYVRSVADAALNLRVDNVLSNIDPAALDSLTEIVSAFQSVDGDLNTSILAVLSEHNAELATFSGDISTELWTEISREHSEHLSNEQVISANLSTELVDRANAVSTEAYVRSVADYSLEQSLTSDNSAVSEALSIEIIDRADADSTEAYTRSVAIVTEAAARLSADQVISANLSTELVDRAAADAELSTNIYNADRDAISREQIISANLSTELVDRANADAALEQSIADEHSEHLSTEQWISANLSTELVNRAAGDATISANLSQELVDRSLAVSTEAYVRSVADYNLNVRVDNVLSNIDPAALDSLTEIVSAFQSVDGDLETSILAVLSEHNAELAQYSIDMSTELSTEISKEHAHHVAGDQVLSANLSTELVDRANAVSTEAYVRSVADYDLSIAITGDAAAISEALSIEIIDRAAADDVISANLSTELVARESADAALSTAISAALSQEAADRVFGDFYVEDTVTGVTAPAGVNPINVPTAFAMGDFDTEVYVNGLRVEFNQLAPNDFELNLVYPLEASDVIRIVGVRG